MQVVILCGGAGTRLAEETETRPKPMVEIGGRPILWHIMKLYSHHGCTDFVLCLGYRGDVIRDYFLNYDLMNSDTRVNIGDHRIEPFDSFHDERNWSVILAETGGPTPTGGRIKAVERYVTSDRFLVTYGDGVSNVNIRRLLSFHAAHGKLATVTAVHPATRFGELDLEGDQVRHFQEKPQVGQGWVSSGFFVFERAVFDYLRNDTMLEHEPLERLAREGQLMAFRHEGYWRPMDTLRDKRLLEEEWAGGSPGWKVW